MRWAEHDTDESSGFATSAISTLLVMAISASLYLRTLAPGLLFGDGAEWQYISRIWGVSHPTGYPTYILLGMLFSRLPLGSVAWRMNLASACWAVVTIVLLQWMFRRQGIHPWLAAPAALIFAVTATFWSQATIAEVYTLNLAFLAAILLMLGEWARSRSARLAFWLPVVYGLAVGNHLSIALLGPVFAAFVLLVDWRILTRPREWVPGVAIFVIEVVGLYSTILWRSRANPPQDWGNPETMPALLDYVSGAYFRKNMFGGGAIEPFRGLVDWWNFALADFGWLGIALALVGLTTLRTLPIARLAFAVLILSGGFAATYRVPDARVFFLPSHFTTAVFIGLGLALAARALASQTRASLGIGLALVLAWGQAFHHGLTGFPKADHRRDDSAERWVKDALALVPPKGVVLAGWNRSEALHYAQWIDGRRLDVEVISSTPQFARRYLHGHAGSVPIFVEPEMASAIDGYRCESLGPLIRILGIDMAATGQNLGPFVDLGFDSARSHLDGSWSQTETRDPGFAWATSEQVGITFDVAVPIESDLHFRVLPAPSVLGQLVRIRINGEQIGLVELMPGWHAYVLPIHGTTLQPGANRATFRFKEVASKPTAPGQDPVAAAFDQVSIEPRDRAAMHQATGRSIVPLAVSIAGRDRYSYLTDLTLSSGTQPVDVELEFRQPDGSSCGRRILALNRQDRRSIPDLVRWICPVGGVGWVEVLASRPFAASARLRNPGVEPASLTAIAVADRAPKVSTLRSPRPNGRLEAAKLWLLNPGSSATDVIYQGRVGKDSLFRRLRLAPGEQRLIRNVESELDAAGDGAWDLRFEGEVLAFVSWLDDATGQTHLRFAQGSDSPDPAPGSL